MLGNPQNRKYTLFIKKDPDMSDEFLADSIAQNSHSLFYFFGALPKFHTILDLCNKHTENYVKMLFVIL